MSSDPFWSNDIKILFSEKRLSEFVPTPEMSTNEKLNSIVRFTIYYAFIVLVLTNNTQSFVVPIVTLVITYFIHDKWGSAEQMENGYPLNEQKRIIINGEECVPPTKDNPLGNFLVSDERNRPEACKTYENPGLKQKMNKDVLDKLYYNLDDASNVKNMERAFFQMPSTKSQNDQTAFAQWCYGMPKTCKEGNSNACADNIDKGLSGFSGGGGGWNAGHSAST